MEMNKTPPHQCQEKRGDLRSHASKYYATLTRQTIAIMGLWAMANLSIALDYHDLYKRREGRKNGFRIAK